MCRVYRRLVIFTLPVHFGHMPSIDRMIEFLAVVRAGSISGAARELGVERATLSRRMSGLEAALSVRLMHRRTTRLVLTDAGQELHRRARRVVGDAEETWASVRRLDDVPRGLLRVSVTGPHFRDMFLGLLQDFPELSLELRATTQHVDLVADGVDVAVRVGEIADPNLIARRVSSDRLVVVGSPDYLDANGTPATAADLASHNCIVGFSQNWIPARAWPLMAGGSVEVHGRLIANQLEFAHDAALKGLGLALMPSAVIANQIRAGQLNIALADIVGRELPTHLVYVDREYIEPKVRVFIDRAAIVVAREMPTRYENI